jgi:hypothetical protein
MLRRDFLRRTSLALAGGLILGDEALEAFARLTHQRKSFPSAAIPRDYYGVITDIRDGTITVNWDAAFPRGLLTNLTVTDAGGFRPGGRIVLHKADWRTATA